MTKKVQPAGSQRGFSAIELMVTLAVSGIVAAMAAVSIETARPSFKGDGAMRVIIAQMNIARELAITQRRNIQIQFINGNQIQLTRQEVPTGTTVLMNVPMEGGFTFALTSGLPDTPDGFGNTSAVTFGAATQMIFSSEGTLADQAGAPISGTVFVSLPGQPRASRAVTILGATGRIRGYKWDGANWVRS
jgi:prepilin-type N-terminal cleavage/methylation domain-containing protein